MYYLYTIFLTYTNRQSQNRSRLWKLTRESTKMYKEKHLARQGYFEGLNFLRLVIIYCLYEGQGKGVFPEFDASSVLRMQNQFLGLNFSAMMGRTSSTSTSFSRKGSKVIRAESEGSSNQLSIGIPLSTCNLNTWHEQDRVGSFSIIKP